MTAPGRHNSLENSGNKFIQPIASDHVRVDCEDLLIPLRYPMLVTASSLSGGLENQAMYFEILAASGGGYFARIKGGNHEIMFVSEVYVSKASARHACEVVQANAAAATIYE